MRRCSLEGNNSFLGGGDDVTDFSSLMLDNRGGVENFLEGFDKFATGLTYSWKMLKNNLQNNCSPFIVFFLFLKQSKSLSKNFEIKARHLLVGKRTILAYVKTSLRFHKILN